MNHATKTNKMITIKMVNSEIIVKTAFLCIHSPFPGDGRNKISVKSKGNTRMEKTIESHRKSQTAKEGYQKKIRKKSGQFYGFFFYISLFFLFSIAGWIWEVFIYLIKDGEFVNRGFLFGPWLPVYGSGGILLIFLLKKWEYKPVKVFFLSMLICSVLEYGTSFCLERIWGYRWWDYSNDFLNINGRICLWGSLMFGLAGWLLICYGIPYLKMIYRKIGKTERGRKGLRLICLLLLVLFIADATWAADFPHMVKS